MGGTGRKTLRLHAARGASKMGRAEVGEAEEKSAPGFPFRLCRLRRERSSPISAYFRVFRGQISDPGNAGVRARSTRITRRGTAKPPWSQCLFSPP